MTEAPTATQKPTITRAMVLAAGKGTRLGEMTKYLPKPLIDVGGQPILLRILETLAQRGFDEIVINTHYLAEHIQEAVALWQQNHDGAAPTIHISHEPELLMIGGGLRQALVHFNDEPFLVVNGDIVWHERLQPALPDLCAAFDPARMDVLLGLSPVRVACDGGHDFGNVHLGSDGRAELPTVGDTSPYYEHVYMGIQVIHPRLLAHLTPGEPAQLRPSWLAAQKAGRLFGHIYPGPWADMGTPKGLAAARGMF